MFLLSCDKNNGKYVGELNILLWLITIIILVIIWVNRLLSISTLDISIKNEISFTYIPKNNIFYELNNTYSYRREISDLNAFMTQYNTSSLLNKKMIVCSDEKPRPKDKFCYFNPKWIYSLCPSEDWNYGYDNGQQLQQPCILLTLWSTKYLQTYENLSQLPRNMPTLLKTHIRDMYATNEKIIPKNIWVSCTHAEQYSYPRGFPAFYFPSQDNPNYLPPVVGVLLNIKVNKNNDIECKLWAKNINHTTDGFATIKFMSYIYRKNGE